MPSSTPLPPSAAAAFEAGPNSPVAGPLAIAAAGELMAERGIFGIVWLDSDLIARTRYGRLVDFIPLSQPITDEVLPLIGLEPDILALKDDPSRAVEVTSVAIIAQDGTTPRLNLTLFWFPAAQRFLLLVSRAISRSDLEAQLVSQMRARLMAEAEVIAKSEELARANTDLSRANRDLEEIIAHDLGAPMRAMRYLVDDLETRLCNADRQTDAEPLAAIAELRKQTRRLSTMLRELHDYSSIGRKQDAVATVGTSELIAAIVASIPHPPGIEVIVEGEWPIIDALAAPLDLVLRNLIDNDVKHHDRDRGAVRVRCEPRGKHLAITVADDGPGIPVAVRDAVFLPFRTLGRPSAGTGMGLALVKRTIDNCGGALMPASQPDLSRGCISASCGPKASLFEPRPTAIQNIRYEQKLNTVEWRFRLS